MTSTQNRRHRQTVVTSATTPQDGPNRFQRRAQRSQKRAANKTEAKHRCALDTEAEKHGVHEPIGLTFPEFHAIHRALGEPRCPRCPHCDTKKQVEIGRAAALATYREKIADAIARDAPPVVEPLEDASGPTAGDLQGPG
jgi:hypothetical protein